jgi:hypothetical protein
LILVACIGVGVSGCDFFAQLNLLLSAANKIQNGQLNQLTAGEIKTLSIAVANAVNQNQPGANQQPLTDAEAAALAHFLGPDCNNVGTQQELQDLIQQAQTDPTQVHCLDELAEAFGNFDPSDPAATQEQFENIFGAAFSG